jgi:hypothetical protein
MIANAATGNFAAVANDLIGIVGNLTNNSFLSNISRLNPLGGFSGGLSDGLLSSNLLSGVIDRSTDPIITRGLDVLNGFLSDQGRVNASVFTAQQNSPVGISNY